ncbi:MAG TPA: hypothetical protein VFN23_02585 [Ktedonobacteraceae bacterium]|nr:hypothetical protein [Ktedonobacteraceae bacterium]
METKNNTQPLNNSDFSNEKTVELVHTEGQASIDNNPDENTVLRIGTIGAAVSDPNAQTEALPDPSPVKLDFMGGPRVISRRRSKPLPLYLTIPLVTLSSLLILSAFGLVLFASTFQYKGALATQALANTQATRSIQSTANAQAQATINALGTVQAQILATATSQAAAQASATAVLDQATAVASQKLDQFSKASTGTPTLDDPLGDNTGKGKWDSGTASPGTGCNFINGSYNVTVGQRGFLQPCLARATSYTNMTYQVQMTIVGGSQGGLLFDANPTANTYYFFRIGTDSTYALDLYNGSSQAQTLANGINSAISPGLNASNTLSVQTNNGEIDLFVNQTYIASVTDTQLSSGEVGVAAIDYNTPTQINFTSAQAWGKLG